MSAQSISPLDDSDEWAALKSRSPTLSLLAGKHNEGEPGGLLQPPQNPNVSVVRVFYLATTVGVDVCGGRIGTNNTRFCTNPCAENSTVCAQFSSHSRKAVVIPSCYYVMSERGSSAYMEPSLAVPSNGFAPEALDVLSGERTVQDWVQIFAQLQSFGDLDFESQLDILNRVDRKAGPGPTPMKLGSRAPPTAFESRLQSVTEPDSWSEVTLMDLNTAMLTKDQDFVKHAGSHWNIVVQATQAQLQRSADLEGSVKQCLEAVDDKIVMVSASLGKPTISATTAWSAIAAHEAALNQVNPEASAIWQASCNERMQKVEQRVNEAHTRIREGVFPIVQDVFNRLEIVASKVDAGTHMQSGGGLNINPGQLIDMIEKLHGEHVQLENKFKELAERDSNGGSETPQEAFVKLQADVAELKAENIRLRMEMQSDALSFGGHFFPTITSVEEFVIKHVRKGYYGFCYDFISLLECYSDRNRDSDEGLSQKHKMGKAGYSDSSSARIDQSFGCVVPMIFGKDQDANNPTKKLTALTNAVIWGHDRSGIKVNIDRFVTNHRRTVDTQITRMFGVSSVATLFFQQMIQKTEVFWNDLSIWITSFEKEMSGRHGTGKKGPHCEDVWHLICWMLHAMFVEMNNRRAEGSAITLETQSGVDKCTSILQGALGAHKFMAELKEAEFVRHSIFASTIHEFLLTNKAPNDALEELAARVTKIETGNRNHQSAADRRKAEGGKGEKAATPK